jgi:hypothetical protein
MVSRRGIAVAVFTVIGLIIAVRWHSQVPEAAAPKAAAVMECVASTTGFEVARYERSVLVAPAPSISLDGSCAEAIATLLSADLQIRSVLVPQPGSQYYVFSQ